MTAASLLWPRFVLPPAKVMASPVPFTRSGGRSLGGIERVTRTDRGYWSIAYKGIPLAVPGRARCWNAIRTLLNGQAGSIAVPVLSYDSAPWPAGTDGTSSTMHSDGTTFSDGGSYLGRTIAVQMAVAASIGDTTAVLRLVGGIDDLAGVRFSYQHALYETGAATAAGTGLWSVPLFPAVRAAIPADAWLEMDMPTCLVHLESDRGMDGSLTFDKSDKVDVSFVEAVDVWNDNAGS